MGEEEFLQIGEVATQVKLSLRTIRHYDEVGLVTPSGRTGGGFRLYSSEDVDRLRIVKGMKPAGLTLEEMRELLKLLESDSPDSERLEHFLAATGNQAERLTRHLDEVKKLNRRVHSALRSSAEAIHR
ncbi:MAG: MerR family transcriptional regulator [Actinomycetota bacterium]|nr:MerR family transcriptional regulator [Actinomycetota bacterium]MDQ2981443.1 MerR family transcriptional regulator [Actinomycetota bacterium]